LRRRIGRDFRDHLVVAVEIDGVDRVRVHVGIVQPAVMPARTFAKAQIIAQDLELSHVTSGRGLRTAMAAEG
jgi:hypothetical protein